MAYATRQDLVDRIGERVLIELTDRNEMPSGAIDETVLARALSDAEAEIDSYLAGKFALPLTDVPVILTRLCCDIVRYLLAGPALTDEIRDRYRDAIAFLKDVAAGRATLGLNSAQETTSPADGPEVSADDRVFSKDLLDDY